MKDNCNQNVNTQTSSSLSEPIFSAEANFFYKICKKCVNNDNNDRYPVGCQSSLLEMDTEHVCTLSWSKERTSFVMVTKNGADLCNCEYFSRTSDMGVPGVTVSLSMPFISDIEVVKAKKQPRATAGCMRYSCMDIHVDTEADDELVVDTCRFM